MFLCLEFMYPKEPFLMQLVWNKLKWKHLLVIKMKPSTQRKIQVSTVNWNEINRHLLLLSNFNFLTTLIWMAFLPSMSIFTGLGIILSCAHLYFLQLFWHVPLYWVLVSNRLIFHAVCIKETKIIISTGNSKWNQKHKGKFRHSLLEWNKHPSTSFHPSLTSWLL